MNGQICTMCHAINTIMNDYHENIKVCVNCGLVYEENLISPASPAHENNNHEGKGDPAINDELNDSSESK